MIEFPTARAAINHARTTGGRAIRMGGRNYMLNSADAEWLESFGSLFAYLHELDGQITTVPVNQ
jgi:hypothetical protein